MYRRHVSARTRLIGSRLRQFVWHNILHADDPPHRLARGAAIGIFVAFTPTLGIQLVLVVLLAAILRGNKVLAFTFVWVSNLATIVPIYLPAYWLGTKLTGAQVTWEEVAAIFFTDHGSWWLNLKHFWTAAMEVAGPLWVGSLVLATFWSLASYAAVFYLVTVYRLRHSRRALDRLNEKNEAPHDHDSAPATT